MRTVLTPQGSEAKQLLKERYNLSSIVPLDYLLGIVKYPQKLTKNLMYECVYWAQNQASFQAAEEVISKIYRQQVSDDTIREATDMVGMLLFREEYEEAMKIKKKFENKELKFSFEKEGTLYLMVDGAMINTTKKNEEGTSWRENKLGLAFTSDDITTKKNQETGEITRTITKKAYTSLIGSVEDFKWLFLNMAIKKGLGQYKNTVVLGDGASWIINMVKELMSFAQFILDLYHLKEHVYDQSKKMFSKEEEMKKWAKKMCDMLEEGKWREVKEELKKYEKNGEKCDLAKYIEGREEYINYKEYKEKEYIVGSGCIESAHRVVMQRRLKQSGMRWSISSAQGLLTIIATEKSNGWNHVKQVIDKKFETSNNLYDEAQKFRKEYFKEDPPNTKKDDTLEEEKRSGKTKKKASSKIKTEEKQSLRKPKSSQNRKGKQTKERLKK